MYFLITKVVLQPFSLLLLLLGVSLATLWRRRKEGRVRLLLTTIVYLLLLLSTIPALTYPLVGALEWPYPPLAERPREAQAIVVLAGGIEEPDTVRRRPELTADTLFRCLYAAELYHDGPPCPVVVTGGVLDPKTSFPAVAPSMRDLLVRLGVERSDVIVEPEARTTFENALKTRVILEGRGLRKVLLVTEAMHMARSLRCFRKQGVNAIPAACHHRATGFRIQLDAFLPSANALQVLSHTLHEYLGLAWYRATGKI